MAAASFWLGCRCIGWPLSPAAVRQQPLRTSATSIRPAAGRATTFQVTVGGQFSLRQAAAAQQCTHLGMSSGAPARRVQAKRRARSAAKLCSTARQQGLTPSPAGQQATTASRSCRCKARRRRNRQGNRRDPRRNSPTFANADSQSRPLPKPSRSRSRSPPTPSPASASCDWQRPRTDQSAGFSASANCPSSPRRNRPKPSEPPDGCSSSGRSRRRTPRPQPEIERHPAGRRQRPDHARRRGSLSLPGRARASSWSSPSGAGVDPLSGRRRARLVPGRADALRRQRERTGLRRPLPLPSRSGAVLRDSRGRRVRARDPGRALPRPRGFRVSHRRGRAAVRDRHLPAGRPGRRANRRRTARAGISPCTS